MSSDVDPAFSSDDLAYIRADYRTLEQLCAERSEKVDQVRRLVDEGRLPQPSYVLPDGTEMFPPDYFDLLDAAGGVDALADWFAARHRAATSALGAPGVDPEEDWQRYLSGQLGVCLREVSPEVMVEKSALVAEIDSLTAVPAIEDEGWRTSLREAVDALDEIERPFTDYDRQRWGRTSRDSHITTVRAKFLSS